jgi:tetratricopeptide (TPR) repeat protein
MKCWSCGSDLPGGSGYAFTCPACRQVEESKEIQNILGYGVSEITGALGEGFDKLSGQLTNIASILEWGFEGLQWEAAQSVQALESIGRSLKNPATIQASEWRQIAEELRKVGSLRDSERFFLKSIEANPLDYQAYIGLGKTYLQLGDGEKAQSYWEKSLPHAPKAEINYASYSLRLIGRLYFCRNDIQSARASLKRAMELSPSYYIAVYDCAQYSALLGDKKESLSSLIVVMANKPDMIELAAKEKNLESVRRETKAILNTVREIRDATEAVKKARKLYVLIPSLLNIKETVELKEAMEKNFKLAQETAYGISLDKVFASDQSIANYIEAVHHLSSRVIYLTRNISEIAIKQRN